MGELRKFAIKNTTYQRTNCDGELRMIAKGHGISFVCVRPCICEKKCLIHEMSTKADRYNFCLSCWQTLRDQ